jgi:hypothetical protein
MAFLLNGREIAPCIVAKAKYALGIRVNQPENRKQCSDAYWAEVVTYLGRKNNKPQINIDNALLRRDLYRY